MSGKIDGETGVVSAIRAAISVCVLCLRVPRFQSAPGGWLCHTGEVCHRLRPHIYA